uniref:NAD-dependent epimerase/dehydratase domain-containing protein n=1 Tax=Phaeomonas parva TaxID=124430 RepID=A0A7S1TNY7_9STRA|mmetsp:Transcript_10349/g.31006  ORF Transcript_10349/g.31006 Transcript_10349/m.31006 type:complete len:120 (+) Transcript_10349:169-528(+)
MGQTFSDEGQFEAICTKRILVTGGTGLVGKGIQAAIKKDPLAADESYIFLSSRDGDLRDKEATRAIFRRHRPTHVIHLAALVGGLFANQRRKVTPNPNPNPNVQREARSGEDDLRGPEP